MEMNEKDMMAEGDLRTMIDAEKIKKDPKRFAAAMKKHKDMMDAMQSVGGNQAMKKG